MFGEKGKLEKIEHLGEKGKWDKLESYTKSSDAQVRAAAYEALGHVNKDESNNILVAGLNDDDPAVRLAVAHGLAEVGTAHSEELLKHRLAVETDPKLSEAFQAAVVACRNRK